VFPGSPKVPFTLGEDIVGVVHEVGEGVSGFEPGQTVAGFSFGSGGGYAEHVCQPANHLVPVPAGLDPAEVVCLVVNYLTAHAAMHRTAEVQSGEQVLIQGAAGGVGTALLELGRLAGLEMYGTASAYNHDLVSTLGATPIDYRTEDFVERVRTLTGDGVDVVFDPVGGARLLRRSYRSLRKGGRLVWFGMAATKKQGLKAIPLTLMMVGLLKLFPGGKQVPLMEDLGALIEAQPTWYPDTLTGLCELLASGEIKPVIADRIPLAEAARAHELLERGGYAGKVVLVTDAYASAA
jgi:NADPH:quinone reductase-like Zn-dependent oxidoreductase